MAACLLTAGAIVALSVATTTIAAQDAKTPEISPGELVRITVANEVAAAMRLTLKVAGL